MAEQPKTITRTRAPRCDKGRPQWTERDLAVLLWMAEQYGVRRDQLAVLLARAGVVATQTPGRLAESTVKDWVQRWRRVDIVGSTLVFAGQPSWVWVTRLGLEHLELDYRLWEPRARGLAHLYAINEARLLVETRYPEAKWHSERALRSGQPFVAGQTEAAHQPDAEVQLGERRVAIEVELSSKSKKRQPTILYGLARHYDVIWYFCPPAQEALIAKAIAALNPPAIRQKFSIVPLRLEGERSRRPTVSPTPPPPARQGEAHEGRANDEGLPRERNVPQDERDEPRDQPQPAPPQHPPQCLLSDQAGAGLHHEETGREQHDERGRGPKIGQGGARRSVGP